MLSILKIVIWIGYGVCGVGLLFYLIGYLKIRKQIKDSEDDK